MNAPIRLIAQSILALFALALLAACTEPQPANTHITVEQPFVRSTPPGQKVTGAFMTLKNHTSADIDLVKAVASVASVTEIHRTSEQDGVMRMQPVSKITIPAKGSVELKPGGLHVMLMGLKKALNADGQISIELHFSDQSQQTIDVPVIKTGG